jgi:hypothetical protein
VVAVTVDNLCVHEQTDFLPGIGLFKDLPKAWLDLPVKEGRVLDCAAGHLFFPAGQTGNSLFVLEKGYVSTFKS